LWLSMVLMSVKRQIVNATSFTFSPPPSSISACHSMSSRPELSIRDSFNSYDLRDVIRTLVLDDHYLPDADIRRYFWSRFENIKQKQTHLLRTYIPTNWPSSQIIQSLVQRSAGQFIYASTMIKFVDSPQPRPVERLDAVLRLHNPMGDIPFTELNYVFSSVHGMYHLVLVSSLSPSRILAFCFLESWGRILGDLHSVINVPASPASASPTAAESGIHIIHPLVDFLTDQSRAGKYFINSVKSHADLARAGCRDLISSKNLLYLMFGP